MDAATPTRTVLGTCHHDCPDTCGWTVTVEGEGSAARAVKLRGNPAHPYSRGELCPKVNRYLDRVYSDQRLLTPLRRVGPKGSGRFEPVGWEDALAEIADRTLDAVGRHGGETVYSWSSAGTQGLLQMQGLAPAVLGWLGASVPEGSVCGKACGEGYKATTGTKRGMDPMDLRHSRLILLWANNTRLTNRHLWPFIEEARAAGAEVVVIDPIRTVTAEAADRFIQPLPGTDAALALGMMHVLFRDDLLDHDYLERYATGVDELRGRAAEWPPERAADVCGITAAEVEWLGRAWGTVRPAAIRALIGAEHRERGAMLYRTLACLPVLTGAWRELGGGFCRSVGTYADVAVDDSVLGLTGPRRAGAAATPRELNVNHLGRHLTDPALDPPVTVLFSWCANPAVTCPNADLVRAGLAREDLFTVVHDLFLTDTARYADIVLPATSQLEHLDVVPSWGHLHLGWNEPAIPPLGEAVSTVECFRRIGVALGMEDPVLGRTERELLETALAPEVLGRLDELEGDGFLRLPLPERLLPFAEGGFETPSGRAELWSDSLTEAGLDPLPTWEPAREGIGGDPELLGRFPLVLLTPKVHTRFLNSSYSHLPRHSGPEGGPYVELDAEDAAVRGIGEGDTVEVVNERAVLTLPARITNRLRPGVVAVPFGWWSAAHADGAVANSLTSDTLTDWGGGVAYLDTLVEVRLPSDR